MKHFHDWGTALRYALAAMFLLTASAHFSHMRADLVRMVPPAFPNPELLVTLTGIAEILGAVGLLIPRFARAAAWGLTLLLLAILPANVYAAQHQLSLNGSPVTELFPRALEQALFLTATLTCALRAGPSRHGSLVVRDPVPAGVHGVCVPTSDEHS
ncbi:MAG TPA: DoxX family membrane protein [Polyangiaceae bacterium]|nr:DoxX family membrane protein [Polyangiaceae bacterium]